MFNNCIMNARLTASTNVCKFVNIWKSCVLVNADI